MKVGLGEPEEGVPDVQSGHADPERILEDHPNERFFEQLLTGFGWFSGALQDEAGEVGD